VELPDVQDAKAQGPQKDVVLSGLTGFQKSKWEAALLAAMKREYGSEVLMWKKEGTFVLMFFHLRSDSVCLSRCQRFI